MLFCEPSMGYPCSFGQATNLSETSTNTLHGSFFFFQVFYCRFVFPDNMNV